MSSPRQVTPEAGGDRSAVASESGDPYSVPKPYIKAKCKTCANAWIAGWEHWTEIISPRGIAHVGLANGETGCGKDATGDRWWWPL